MGQDTFSSETNIFHPSEMVLGKTMFPFQRLEMDFLFPNEVCEAFCELPFGLATSPVPFALPRGRVYL